MKKLLILALFVLGICNVCAYGIAQEIILTELYSIMPIDDPGDSGNEGGPDPTRIHASIDGNQFSVDAGTGERVYVEIIDPETGEVIAEEEVESEATMPIPEEGDYEVYIYTETGSVLMGEFEVK